MRVEQKGELNVVGFSVSAEINEVENKIVSIWEKLRERNGEIENLIEGAKDFGVCVKIEKGKGGVKYVAGREVSEFRNVSYDMNMEIVSEAKYAVFNWKGELHAIALRSAEVKKFIQTHKLKDQGFWLEFFDSSSLAGEKEFEIWVALDG